MAIGCKVLAAAAILIAYGQDGVYGQDAASACTAMDCKTCVAGKPTECSVCKDGFRLNVAKCEACPTNCMKCMADKMKCETCNQGFKLGATDNKCTAMCTITNCAMCKDEMMCEKCTKGYFVNGKTCTACSMGCMECTAMDTCVMCNAVGYYMDDKKMCKACHKGCNKCASATMCDMCNPEGYFMDSKKMCQACMENCKMCDANMCKECMPNFEKSADGKTCGKKTEKGQAASNARREAVGEPKQLFAMILFFSIIAPILPSA